MALGFIFTISLYGMLLVPTQIPATFQYCMFMWFPRLHPDGTQLWWVSSQMAEDWTGSGVLQRGAHQNWDRERSLGGQTETRPQPSRCGDPAPTEGWGWMREVGTWDQLLTLVCWGCWICLLLLHLIQRVSHLFSTCISPTQDRQIQLIRDLLTSEGSSNSIQLSAEQRSALAFLSTNSQAAANINTSRR